MSARWLEALRTGVSRSPLLARVVTGYRSTNPTRSRLPHVVNLAGDRAIDSKAGKLARRATLGATVAASFVLGWVAHTWRPLIAPGHNSPAMARTFTVQPAQESETSSLDEPSLPAQTVSNSPGEDQSPANPSETIREVATLLIQSETAQTEVPILAGPGIDSEWINNQPPPISEYEQVVFQRHGYQVNQRRA